ncbi:Superkiller protein 3 [Globomyces sp. JEL0801]|nr:Superkiller protein 3 [Globomyces sp. JEL0801]
MSFLKTQLKAARDAINSKSYEYAQELCETILENDSSNYNACVFLGVAYQEQELFTKAIGIYEKAISISPTQPLAYQGLLKLYEKTRSVQDIDQEGHFKTLDRVANLYIKSNDAEKYLGILNNRIQLSRELKDNNRIMESLQKFLPGVEGYHLIQDFDIVSPKSVWTECIDITEERYRITMQKEINSRKTRLGAPPLSILTLQIESELLSQSTLDTMYESILALDLNEEEKVTIQMKQLEFLSRKLIHAPAESKQNIQSQVFSLACTLLNAKKFSSLAYQIVIESENQALENRSEELIQRYLHFGEDDSSSYKKLIDSYVQTLSGDDDNDALEDVLAGLEENSKSIFGNQILAQIFKSQKEWSSLVDCCETLIKVAKAHSEMTLMPFDNQTNASVILDAELTLAESYIQLGDRCTAQALSTYRTILEKSSSNVEALMGIAKALISIHNTEEAKTYLNQILTQHPDNIDAKIEIAWIYYIQDDTQAALNSLIEVLELDQDSYLIHYRLAKCYSRLGGEFVTDKQYTHQHLIKAIKLNPHYSPSFTQLGNYYREVENDLDRASKCYSKAISTNPKDNEAIQSVTAIWLSQNKIGETNDLLKQFVSFVPRSTWAWKQLGILSLHVGRYSEAISHFQTSLRIIPKDSISWISLGEAYIEEGKYMAALKALDRAIELEPTTLTAFYLKGIVNNKLGLFAESCANFQNVLDSLENDDSNFMQKIPSIKGLAETLNLYAKELYEQGAYGSCLTKLMESIQICQKGLEFDHKSYQMLVKLLSDACFQIYNLVPELFDDSCAELLSPVISFLDERFNSKINQTGLQQYGVEHSSNLHVLLNCATISIQNGIVWSNLGFFYLLHDDLDLAKQCFQKCQFNDPDVALGWLGQAFIAELVGAEDAFELFEHAYELGRVTNFEILYQFARHCFLSPQKYISSVTVGSFLLLKLSEKKHMDPAAYNLYGIFLEQLGQTDLAINAFQNALEYLDSSKIIEREAVSENLARCYCSSLLFGKAIEVYQEVIGYGLALYFDNQFAESLMAFQSALEKSQEKSGNSQLINDTTLYLSQVLFALGTEDHVNLSKDQLLQCFSNDPTYVRAIINIAVLGLVIDDWVLAQTAAAELLKLEPDVLDIWDEDMDNGQSSTARGFLAKSVHRYNGSKSSNSLSLSALSIASHANSNVNTELESISQMSDIELVAGINSLVNGDLTGSARRHLSKSIMLSPSNAKNWIALSLELSSKGSPKIGDDTGYILAHKCALTAQLLNTDSDLHNWSTLISGNAILGSETLQLSYSLQDSLAEIDPIVSASEGTLKQIGYFLLGRILNSLGELDSSIMAVKQAFVESMNGILPWMTPLNRLGLMYYNCGRVSAAKMCFTYAQKLFPLNANPPLLLADLQIKCDEFDEALNTLKAVTQLDRFSIPLRFLQTLILSKIDSEKSKSRISKNKDIMKDLIPMPLIEWLDVQ